MVMPLPHSDLFDAGVAATTDAEVQTLDTEEKKSQQIAKVFLAKTCPSFLQALEQDPGPSSKDRLIKAGRNIAATIQYAQTSSSNSTTDDTTLRREKATGALSLLVEECATMADILTEKEQRRVPKVRYGKTELQMPIVTLGCMRFQQSWNRDGAPNVTKIDQVDKECQDNLVNILKYAIRMGVNHIETAKGYGCSEMQIGHALEELFKSKYVKREDLIIQTKGTVAVEMTPKSYKKQIVAQLQRLKLKYVDLFSVHGLNSESEFKYLFDNDPEKGNLITALQELQAEGKIRNIGFSTHARADLIRRAIETDAFAYINIHHHFVGSYTASGDSTGSSSSHHGNWDNIQLARSKDMGVFIISPYDKGGRLYAPSVKLRELTLPEFEPMAYGSLWLWQYHLHQKTPVSASPMAHTIVCGAARPSDLDQPILASFQMIPNDDGGDSANLLLAKTVRVHERLEKRLVEALPGGQQWVNTWHHSVPNWFHAKYGTQHGNLVWLYNIIHAFGLLDFAKERYAMLDPRTEKWDDAKLKEENVAQYGGVWHWVPGCGISVDRDYSEDFANCPEENKQQLKDAVGFVHKWCRPAKKDDDKNVEELDVPFEWETSYDMRPWTAFPERE